MRWCPEAAFVAGTALAVVAAVAAASPYPDSPPPAHTGGFGEPTCHACHFDNEVGGFGGELTLDGVPAAWEPGRRYELVVRLSHPELRRAGFELAARLDDGTQAGRLKPLDEAVGVTPAADVQYAHHTLIGSQPDSGGVAAWRLVWVAPDSAAGAVLFHVAANAANGDDSAFGDRVYVGEWAVGSREE